MGSYFFSKFTKNNLVKAVAAACIAASVAFGQSGTTGPLSWSISGGTLTISGTGAMPDYGYGSAPWASSQNNITSVVIEGSVTTIGDNAFPGHLNLTSVTIGNSVTSIGRAAFSICRNLTSVTIGNSVTSIGDYAFSSSGLTSITIPDLVKSIGGLAFSNCGDLTSVTIGASVTTIGNDVFANCLELTAVNIDENNTNFVSDNGVLFNKAKTTLTFLPYGKAGAYTIPDGVTTVVDNAFSNRNKLTSVTIPASIINFGPLAAAGSSAPFSGCSELTEINVDGNNTNFASDNGVLFNKAKTTIIKYPGGKTGAYTIPNSVTSIGRSAFSGCAELTGVTIPNSVTSIENWAFADCTLLTEVTIPNVTSIKDATFSGCTGLTSFTIPNSVKTIERQAFERCTGLTGAFTIPNSVTSIGSLAFQNCNKLTAITIGSSVTSIGTYAFNLCNGLKRIINRNATPQTITADVFANMTLSGIKLFVPASAIDAYKAATVWSSFSAQTAAIPFTVKAEIAVGQTLAADFDEAAGYTGEKVITLTINDNPPAGIVVEGDKIKATAGAGNTVRITATLDGDYFSDFYFVNVIKGKVGKPGVTATGLVYDKTEKSAGIAANELYEITGDPKATNAGTHTAHVDLKDKDNYEWEDGETDKLTLTWTIAKAAEVFGTPAAVNTTYTPTLKLENVALPEHYAWTTPATALSARDNQSFAATFTDPSGNYNPATGEIVVNVAKATAPTPTGLTAKVGQTLAEVSPALPAGWSWINSATVIAAPLGEQTHKAKFTPMDAANYNVLTDIDVKVAVSAPVPIREIQKSDGRTGIRLSKNVVSDKAEFEVILPNDKVLEVKAVIYDNTGNAVFEKVERGANISWNLTNAAGRNVANGSYLIIAEAKGAKGTYAYSAKVGVKK